MGKIQVQNRNIVGESVRKLAYDIREKNFSTFLPRDAMHPRYYPWPCVRPSVCPSVRPSQVGVLLKTAKRRITQTTPHDSPGTLVF